MWNRKQLKDQAKQVVKRNYWTMIVVCFLLALLTGEFGTTILGVWQSDDTVVPNYLETYKDSFNKYVVDKDKLQAEEDEYKKIEGKKSSLTDTQEKIWELIEVHINSFTKAQKYAFKIWDATELFDLNQVKIGIELCVAALISLGFTIFIAEPLIVAGKKYFLEARKENNAEMGVILKTFKRGNWLNVVKIMLIKNIYLFLWYLTIIGGFIKSYEYMMIPYILAENPKITKKEAFRLSKEMMKGNKWKAFILDISFILWNLASVLTFGVLGIFYVNPYKVATITELYCELKEK